MHVSECLMSCGANSALAADYKWLFILFDAHFTQFQLMYVTSSETIANMNNDTKASNESTSRHRIAIHYTGYSEGSAVL